MVHLRFHKLDKFEAPIFIINSTEPGYKDIARLHKKIKRKFPDEFLPTYHNSEYKYYTIRFHKDYGHPKFTRGEIYDIKFKFYVKKLEDKTRVSASVDELQYIGKKVQDLGDVLDL